LVQINDSKNVRRKSPARANRQIHLGGATLDHRAHICAFFNSRDEEYRVLLPFLEEGLKSKEKNVHTVDPRLRDDHHQRLALAGVDVEAANESGQFELRDWSDTHLAGGHFDQHRTLALFRQIIDKSTLDGFPLTRFVTNMEWALEANLDTNALLEYEATTNNAWLRQDGPINPVICTYDLNRFTANIIVDVMRAHPMVIIGGVLRENPFFVPPEEFLEELHARRARIVELQRKYAQLTPREREVLPFVVAGRPSKQTADELGTSEITIRVHRRQIMRKMKAHSLAELIRMTDMLESNPEVRYQNSARSFAPKS
jgi:DNA-binding CsgD family transcriptional regulator